MNAKLNIAPLLDAVSHQSMKVASGSPASIGITLFAYATIGVKAKEIFSAVAQQAPRIAASGSVQDISRTVHAFSEVGYVASERASERRKLATEAIERRKRSEERTTEANDGSERRKLANDGSE